LDGHLILLKIVFFFIELKIKGLELEVRIKQGASFNRKEKLYGTRG